MMAGLLEMVSLFCFSFVVVFTQLAGSVEAGVGASRQDVRRGARVLSGGCQLNLDPINTVDTVDEENQNEDEGDLEPVLDFCDYRVLGNEAGGPMVSCAIAETTTRR
jgi:hypothetical protein